MNKYILYTSCLMLSWGMGLSTPCNAQNKRNAKRAKTTKAALIVNINTTIVDEDNRPIRMQRLLPVRVRLRTTPIKKVRSPSSQGRMGLFWLRHWDMKI